MFVKPNKLASKILRLKDDQSINIPANTSVSRKSGGLLFQSGENQRLIAIAPENSHKKNLVREALQRISSPKTAFGSYSDSTKIAGVVDGDKLSGSGLELVADSDTKLELLNNENLTEREFWFRKLSTKARVLNQSRAPFDPELIESALELVRTGNYRALDDDVRESLIDQELFEALRTYINSVDDKGQYVKNDKGEKVEYGERSIHLGFLRQEMIRRKHPLTSEIKAFEQELRDKGLAMKLEDPQASFRKHVERIQRRKFIKQTQKPGLS